MKKPGLPSSPRTPGREQFDTAVKETLEIITGRRGVKVSPITGSYDVEHVAKKLNELINFFHGGGEPASDESTFSGSENPWLSNVAGTNAVTAVASPAPEAYVAGQAYRFVATGTNTGPVTLNISGLGARNVTKNGTTALAPGDIPGGAIAEVVFDGTRFQLINVALSGGNGRLLAVNYYTSGTGTYTKATNNPSFVIVEVIGGGGGGGGIGTVNGAIVAGGGGGGGYTRERILASSLSSSVNVVIGAGGTAGTTSGGNGGSGGTSSFGSFCSATGGGGGTGNNTGSGIYLGGPGGSGFNGDLNITGGSGGNGGGNSFLGAGGAPASSVPTSGLGTSGVSASANSGGGGAGAQKSFLATAYAGGAGGSGLVIVWEYA